MEIVTFPKIILVCTLFYQKYLFNYGPFPASRSSFRPFLFTIQIKMKMRRYAHGKQTRDHGMVGIDGSTELWRPTKNIFALFNNAPIINVVTNTCVSFWNFQLRGPTLLLRFKLRRRLSTISFETEIDWSSQKWFLGKFSSPSSWFWRSRSSTDRMRMMLKIVK